MSESIALISAPVAEPVSLTMATKQLNLDDGYTDDDGFITGLITAARQACENYTNRVLLTQTWILRRDSFPGHNLRYQWDGYPQINLPKPPFQSVASFQYVDVSGTPQTLTQDTTYGTNPANPQYGYQLERGSETQPARLLPPFARPWPPTRMVPANVIVQFRCGYGGPITCSMAQDSAVLTVSGGAPLSFNADDAPLLPGETGLPISVPGAGPAGAVLNTFIASVNPANGQATLATPASTAVSGAAGWAGQAVPSAFIRAMLLLIDFYYENRGETNVELPQAVKHELDPYLNWAA